jgi:predicted nucleotidyltransferase
MPNKGFLNQLATERLRNTTGSHCLDDCIEVIVFGSMSAGLERPDSDIEILCFGNGDSKLKTDRIDLIVMPSEAMESSRWLGSELASHIVEYGTWIKGRGDWSKNVRIGNRAIEAKRRRIATFMRALPNFWISLDESFRVKYSIKLRRETQRLILMEHGTPVPPTRILDGFLDKVSHSPAEICDYLRRFSASSPSAFSKDLLARISAAPPLSSEM